MVLFSLLLVLAAADADDRLSKKMLPIYVKEVETYSLTVKSAPKQALELKKEPVFEWLNPARNAQQGTIFLWLRNGRPAALACIFSAPNRRLPGRNINHELHALDVEKLVVKRDQYNQWKPQAGLARKQLSDATPPAAARGARLLQMRRLAQEFGGHSLDRDGKRWQLRLLPTPLYRYPAAKSGIVDGALFALMSSAGTDPEVLLLLEVKKVDGNLHWQYACGRFSDWELHVQRKDKEVFASIPSESNPFAHDPLHLYRLYQEKVVTLEGKLLARIRPKNPHVPWGEIVPVKDK
ncbi:MAG TPA: hypothetical protein VMG10_03920 [Gemmataceae bacterium]|nr:hypothetical protein [Gemmataceae bacterium]